MPYKTISSLPDSVKNHLPKHAQEIYLAAFNNAWEQYRDPEGRRGKAGCFAPHGYIERSR